MSTLWGILALLLYQSVSWFWNLSLLCAAGIVFVLSTAFAGINILCYCLARCVIWMRQICTWLLTYSSLTGKALVNYIEAFSLFVLFVWKTSSDLLNEAVSQGLSYFHVCINTTSVFVVAAPKQLITVGDWIVTVLSDTFNSFVVPVLEASLPVASFIQDIIISLLASCYGFLSSVEIDGHLAIIGAILVTVLLRLVTIWLTEHGLGVVGYGRFSSFQNFAGVAVHIDLHDEELSDEEQPPVENEEGIPVAVPDPGPAFDDSPGPPTAGLTALDVGEPPAPTALPPESPNRNSVMSSTSPTTSADVPVRNIEHKLQQELDKRRCVICQDKVKSVLILPCRHMCMCSTCANIVVKQERNDYGGLPKCPLCRTTIETVMSVFT